MKQRVSITLDEETLALIERAMKNEFFRNRSHTIEFILKRTLREIKVPREVKK